VAKTVADVLWEMLVSAGVRRCYGIVGDALNPTIDALRRNGSVDFVHVRHEEYGTFAAVAEASLTGRPVAVCGTAGPGTAHLIMGSSMLAKSAPRSSPSPATWSPRSSTRRP
jgi:pyruvate dehydrogenase (quinone)